MSSIGNKISKAIYQNLWLKIEYKNLSEEKTSFMIGVLDINPFKKTIKCDAFNTRYDYVTKEYVLFFDSILKAEIIDKTYHETPRKLIDKINRNPEQFQFLDTKVDKANILDYYIESFKLDTKPYVSQYGLVEGLDQSKFLTDKVYQLNEKQFEILAGQSFFQKENKEKKREKGLERTDIILGMNILSINTHKGLYVLAYSELLLNIKDKTLIPSKDIIVNKEFILSKTNNVEYTESIYKFLPEEDYYLLDDFKNNYEAISNSIRQYNNSKTTSYANETKIDSRPFIINLGKTYMVDIDYELGGIKQLVENGADIPLPIRTFFGNPEKLPRRHNYPIFTVDKQFNVDQINAIHIALRSPVSYIQGPPGTGKTQTLLNAILTTQFNGKTVLVTSNNNIPMDGIYDKILELKYNDKQQLLFPAIRLGSKENVIEAIKRIRQMYKIAKPLVPKNSLIKKIKDERKEDMKNLIEYLQNMMIMLN